MQISTPSLENMVRSASTPTSMSLFLLPASTVNTVSPHTTSAFLLAIISWPLSFEKKPDSDELQDEHCRSGPTTVRATLGQNTSVPLPSAKNEGLRFKGHKWSQAVASPWTKAASQLVLPCSVRDAATCVRQTHQEKAKHARQNKREKPLAHWTHCPTLGPVKRKARL
jgi:hypothetical protein